MDFARKILANYGWKEGDGLGKNNDGIAKPLRATLKFDNAGFGADQAAADFNNHWWERVFNEAATNVNIEKEGEKIKMSTKDEDGGVEISTKAYSMKKLKKLKKNRKEGDESKNGYENFLQAATLTNLGDEVENPDKIDTNDIEVSKVKVLTDEELFKACGGRTAHKGARHGLKLSGKLSRIEQQEAELLARMMAKRNSASEDNKFANKSLEIVSNNETFPAQETQRKKKSKTVSDVPDELEVEKIKKKKKKRKHTEEEECAEEAPLETQEISISKSKKNKRKEVLETEMQYENKVSIPDDTSDKIKSKKKKKNKDTIIENNVEEEIVHKKKNKHE